jgi:hypothetical protein
MPSISIPADATIAQKLPAADGNVHPDDCNHNVVWELPAKTPGGKIGSATFLDGVLIFERPPT